MQKDLFEIYLYIYLYIYLFFGIYVYFCMIIFGAIARRKPHLKFIALL